MCSDNAATLHHKKVKIRPITMRIDFGGRVLPPIDDWWRVEGLPQEKLRLVNYRTNHTFTLPVSYVRELQIDSDGATNGFLHLKGQLVLKGSGVYVENYE